MTRHLSVAVTLTLVVAATACGVRGKSVKFTTTRFLAPEAISAADQARLDDNCPHGAPKALPDWPIGKTEMIYRDGYVLEHSSEWKVPYLSLIQI